MEIKNNVIGGSFVQRTSLKNFQGDLKKERPDLIEKLKHSILTDGFDAPIYTWYGHDDLILDGHQRKKALDLLASEGYFLPGDNVPCIQIKANTESEARKKVVEYNARYSEMDAEAFKLWIEGLDVELLPLEEFGIMPLQVDLQTQEKNPSLTEKFGIPPFSIRDTRQGYRQQRKRERLSLGIKSEIGRSATVSTGSLSGAVPNFYSYKAKEEQKQGRKLSIKEFEQNYLKNYFDANKSQLAFTEEGGLLSVFDPVVCEICYTWFCPEGGTILDPFAGGSVRGIVASKLGYQYYGVDLRAEQIEANQTNAQELISQGILTSQPQRSCGNSKTALPQIEADFIFSCPPYVDLEVYSDDPQDLSTMDYQDFLIDYTEIIKQALLRLKPNRFACFVVGEVRDKKTGIYHSFVEDTKRAFIEHGAGFYNDIVLVNTAGSVPLRAGGQFSSSRKVGKVHQNILVFYKGDPKVIKNEFGPIEISEISPETLA